MHSKYGYFQLLTCFNHVAVLAVRSKSVAVAGNIVSRVVGANRTPDLAIMNEAICPLHRGKPMTKMGALISHFSISSRFKRYASSTANRCEREWTSFSFSRRPPIFEVTFSWQEPHKRFHHSSSGTVTPLGSWPKPALETAS